MSGILHPLFHLTTSTISCKLVQLLLFPRFHNNYAENLNSAASRVLLTTIPVKIQVPYNEIPGSE